MEITSQYIGKKQFQPIKIEITIENEEEFNMLSEMCNLNVTIPGAIEQNISSKKGNPRELCENFLRLLNNHLIK